MELERRKTKDFFSACGVGGRHWWVGGTGPDTPW